jgi:hypothetical protein
MTEISNQILETAEGVEGFAQSAGSLAVRDDHQIAPHPILGQWRKIAPAIAIATQLLLVEEIPNYEMRTQVAISNRDVIFVRDVIFGPAEAWEGESTESSDVFVIPRMRPVLFAMKDASIRMIGPRRPFIVASTYSEDDE